MLQVFLASFMWPDPIFSAGTLSLTYKHLTQTVHIDSILMNERWKLIQAGHNRRSIKIRKNSIFWNGNLFGHLDGSNFRQVPSPAVYPAPLSSNTSQQSSADMDTHSTNIDTDSHDSNDVLTPQSL